MPTPPREARTSPGGVGVSVVWTHVGGVWFMFFSITMKYFFYGKNRDDSSAEIIAQSTPIGERLGRSCC